MKPLIYSVAASSGISDTAIASAMSEVTDNESVEIDPYELTRTVGESKAAAEASLEKNDAIGSCIELANERQEQAAAFLRGAWQDVRNMWESNLEERVQRTM